MTALRAEGGGIAMGPLCDPGSEDAPRGRKGARLRRRLCRRVVSPQGKRLTMICASLVLLQIMFAVHRFAQGATAPAALRMVVSQWGHSVTRVQRMRPEGARGRGFAAGCVEGLCTASLRGRRPFGPRVVVSPYRAMSFIIRLRRSRPHGVS